MKCKTLFTLVLGLLPLVSQANDNRVQVEVFMAYQQPIATIPGMQITAYFLQDQQVVEDWVNKNMPDDPTDAEVYLKNIMDKQGEAFSNRIIQAHQGQYLFEQYQLKRLPAYVFDRQVVSYEPTITDAIQEYQTWLNN